MNYLKKLGLACLLLLSAVVAQAETTVPQIEMTPRDGGEAVADNALLMNTHMSGEINGMVATINIQQVFKNQSDNWVNGKYVFPLPEDAAIHRLTITVDGRKISAQIKEKAEAKQIYETAKASGKKAALLEENRPNLFSMNVANIPPHAEIAADIEYVDTAHYENGKFSLRFPTTLTPRYIPGSAVGQVASSGWSPDTTAVPDAHEITPPQTHERPLDSNQFDVTIALNAGVDVQSIDGSQAIHYQTGEADAQEITLQNKTAPMDADFILSWTPVITNQPQISAFNQEKAGEYYHFLMMTPPKATQENTVARDVIFAIDRSGSMYGASMEQAKASLMQGLSYLQVNDTFNIVEFSHHAQAFFAQDELASPENIANATLLIDRLYADGGTEIQTALETALQLQGRHDGVERTRQVIFITDGSVGNEAQIFSNLQSELGNARLFMVGIGAAPNTYFLQKAAEFGRGTSTYIDDSNSITEKMDNLFKDIRLPLFRDIKITTSPNAQLEMYPQKVPDLYHEKPMMIAFKSDTPIKTLSVSGYLGEKQLNQSIDMQQATQNDNVSLLWARRKIASIIDSLNLGIIDKETARSRILPVALANQLVSKYTSFVAVDEQEENRNADPQNNQNVQVANLMPQGNLMAAPYPQTATAAELLQYIGWALLLLSFIAYFFKPLRRKFAAHFGK